MNERLRGSLHRYTGPPGTPAVHAGKIIWTPQTYNTDNPVKGQWELEGEHIAFVSEQMVEAGGPVPGDYFVMMEDGTELWYPQANFESGFTRVKE